MNTTAIAKTISLLGTRMRDRVTGFTGMVSSVSFDAYGCIQCVITPDKKPDGTLGDGHWFDVKRLEADPAFTRGDGQARVMPAPDYERIVFGEEQGAAEKPAGRI